jgi:formamidopyrimidine-DNA glycosylase
MPELPDIVNYIAALEPRILGQQLTRVRIASTFLLRSTQPPIKEVEGRVVRELRRIGKRTAIGLENDLWLVLHLMIAGRLHWRPPRVSLAGRNNLAAFDFPNGSLILTEAGTKRRASLHLLNGKESLNNMDPGGIDVLSTDLQSFRAALGKENRTRKRALTDPRLMARSRENGALTHWLTHRVNVPQSRFVASGPK